MIVSVMSVMSVIRHPPFSAYARPRFAIHKEGRVSVEGDRKSLTSLTSLTGGTARRLPGSAPGFRSLRANPCVDGAIAASIGLQIRWRSSGLSESMRYASIWNRFALVAKERAALARLRQEGIR